MPRARPSPRAVVSKLAEMEARLLLPLGEGGPKGRMRVHFLPSPGASRHPLPRERDMPETGFQIENPMKPASILLLERTAFRNLDKSAPRGRGTRFLIFDKLKMSRLRPLLFQE